MNATSSNRKLTAKLVLATMLMFGFGFALVPLYDVMCDALGINGKTNQAAVIQPQGMQPDLTRSIRVEFMAHVTPGMPWEFKPKVTSMEVHPGEVIQTEFVAVNQSGDMLVGQAVPSVAPGQGATYFNKIECFCFNQQPLDARQQASMPLIFYIEPDIPESIHTLTLSYTLYKLSSPAGQPEVVSLSGSEQQIRRGL
ncbi:cytochrome c oxidase assembly protein [Vibrio sp. CAU 1672]|uniref:cytochrome c oxidase assembly protein n=1 Tax=Vibrio sp. CAU 1672 TaxID=3032594 RepID=UPI0023DA6B96|nr:cytochrome c oxidase assembly protein [Vibrio sp. CAU 1672]MDF2152726.1 cytochrome c oxidase assembly protein [Vibrio sp. CAU 1672]